MHQINDRRRPAFFESSPGVGTTGEAAVIDGASRQEGERQMEMNRHRQTALSADMLELKQPILSDDHAQRAADLDAKIRENGITFDRETILKIGGELFQELLTVDREARAESVIGPPCDLASFASVRYWFTLSGAAANLNVPQVTTSDQFDGSDKELEIGRQIVSWADEWKFSGEPRATRLAFDHHCRFARLAFGQSLYVWIESDGRIHHKFFAGGSGEKVQYLFDTWLPALTGEFHRVLIKDSLGSLVFWVGGEDSAPPLASQLAQHWFDCRVPSLEQIALVQAVWGGFLLNLSGWRFFNHVGAVIRKVPDKFTIDRWLDELGRWFPKVKRLYRDSQKYFNGAVGHYGSCQCDLSHHREFFSQTWDDLQSRVSEIVALTVQENSPADAAPIAARFRDQLLLVGEPKPKIIERVRANLAAAFPGALFNLEILQ
ncbi:MAG TPA: hypothetical protein VGG02_14510 [Chthoniobacterales bacterium]|jgi:hypothetical protein